MTASRPDLPATLPIFPLDGVLLLPHGHLPLHVFEPRYRAMIEAALGERRLIGMIQPRRDYPHPLPDDALIYDVGCAGRIVSFAESDDGRFLITLRGVCRFRIQSEMPIEQGFRRVSPDFVPFLADLEPIEDATVDRQRLLDAARIYLKVKSISCDWAAVETASLPALITSLAMICPFESGEKQALLETTGLSERGELLVSLLELAVLETEAPAAGTVH